MDLLHISSAVVWVDFLVILISRFYPLTKSLDVWYKDFGIVAVISDCLVIVLGILIAQFIKPNAGVTDLAILSIMIQVIHDFLFYIGVIIPIPKGHNSMIDLFKRYSSEGGYQIILADSAMIAGTVYLSDYLYNFSTDKVVFIGLLGLYAITYIIYTH